MDKIHSWLNFEEGTSQDELQEGLKGLILASLRILCKEEKVKSSGTKAELIGRLVSNWKLKFNFGEESMDDPSTSSSIADQRIPVFASPDFYLESKELKTTSNYYYQVQGEMAIKGCTWAHFEVWTAAKTDNIFIQEIKFDEQLWSEEILPTLKTFHLNALVPEILTRRIQKEMFLTGTTAVN